MLEITLGYVLVILAVIFILGMIILLVAHSFLGSTGKVSIGWAYRDVEKVGIIEGACIVEQQRSGREKWRRAEVKIPNRDLTFEEMLNLKSIQESQSRTVILPEAYRKKATTPPPSVDVQEGRWSRVRSLRTEGRK